MHPMLAGEIRMGGQWITEESKLHINAKELLAAFLAIHYFAAKRQQATLSIHLVNRAAVAYINRLGGTASQQL